MSHFVFAYHLQVVLNLRQPLRLSIALNVSIPLTLPTIAHCPPPLPTPPPQRGCVPLACCSVSSLYTSLHQLLPTLRSCGTLLFRFHSFSPENDPHIRVAVLPQQVPCQYSFVLTITITGPPVFEDQRDTCRMCACPRWQSHRQRHECHQRHPQWHPSRRAHGSNSPTLIYPKNRC